MVESGLEPMLNLDFLFNKCVQNVFCLTHTYTHIHTPPPPGPSHFWPPLLSRDGLIAPSFYSHSNFFLRRHSIDLIVFF